IERKGSEEDGGGGRKGKKERMEEALKSLSLDYLNLLINGQAFSDVTFSVEGRLVHAHRCILAARSLFFRRFFCGTESPPPGLLSSPRGGAASPGATGAAVVIPVNSVSYEVFLLMLQFLYSGQVSVVPQKHEPRPNCGERGCWHTHCTAAVDLALDTLAAARSFGVKQLEQITEVASPTRTLLLPILSPPTVHLDVALFLGTLNRTYYSTTLNSNLTYPLPKKKKFMHHYRFLELGALLLSHDAITRSTTPGDPPILLFQYFMRGINLEFPAHHPVICMMSVDAHVCCGWVQKQLASVVEKASIEDVMKVLMASRQQDMQQLWATCSHLVAKSGLPAEVLAKHLPIDVVARIEELRLKSSLARRSSFVAHHPHQIDVGGPAADLEDHHHKIRRMRRALDSSDVELVKLMVMGEGLNLDDALALHYAVENCSREVVKALLELGAADVNCPAGPTGKTPLHIAAEMVCPDMVAVLLDHHADPNVRTVDGVTPLDILRTLTSDFLFKGAVPGLSHIEPNKLRLCLELVQSAALVLSREEANCGGGTGGAGNSPSSAIYPRMNPEIGACNTNSSSSSMVNLSLDSRMVYLNLGMAAQFGSKMNDGGGDESGSGRSRGGGIGPSSMYPSHAFP
ncbi:hypothetical protein B296_00048625, partial [Ensete ventricosum]